MPFSAFHLGVGALAKSVTPSRASSFQIFLLSQVLIDIQPGLGLLLDWEKLHGWTHTYLGALFIAFSTILLWRLWEQIRPLYCGNTYIGLKVLIGSTLFGTFSHIWLDSQFHAEMAGITPQFLMFWTTGDVRDNIETFCIASAMLALLIWVVRKLAWRIWHLHLVSGMENHDRYA